MPEDEPGPHGSWSPRGEHLDHLRRLVALPLGPAAFALLLAFPPAGLTTPAARLLAVSAWILVWWIGEAVPLWTSALLAPVLCVLLRIAPVREAFAAFADPILFLFIGSFLLARGMIASGLDRRIALGILSLPGIGRTPFRLLLGLGLIPLSISMWVSDSATTAMVLPIAIGILASAEGSLRRGSEGFAPRFPAAALLVVAYSSLIGGVCTPIGTPPNLIGLGFLRQNGMGIPFFKWMVLAIPIALLLLGAMLLVMRLLHPAGAKRLTGLPPYVREQRTALGPWTRAQRYALGAFCLAVALWVSPGVTAAILGPESAPAKFLETHIPEGVASLLAALLLLAIPLDWRKRSFVLDARAVREIDWGTILLFGGGLSLGGLLVKTGLSKVLGDAIVGWTGVRGLWGITALGIGLAILLTETTSNTATANALCPILLAIATSAGVSPLPPILGVCLGASMAFMLPVSTPSNAIVYGTGRIPLPVMVLSGVFLDILSFLIILAGLRVLCPLLGLA